MTSRTSSRQDKATKNEQTTVNKPRSELFENTKTKTKNPKQARNMEIARFATVGGGAEDAEEAEHLKQNAQIRHRTPRL